MSTDLCKLPFAFCANIDGSRFSGVARVIFECTEHSNEILDPFIDVTATWAKAASQQFFTCGEVDARISPAQAKVHPENSVLSLELSCENVESGAWLALLALIAQTAYPDLSLKTVEIHLASSAVVAGADAQTWPNAAATALSTPRFVPEAFRELDQIIVGETIDVSIEFARKLKKAEFAYLEDGLELWGFLVGMGALRSDFEEMEEFEPDFGSTSQLPAEWIEYSKPVFEGPIESIYLLDHWAQGLARRGLTLLSLQISQ